MAAPALAKKPEATSKARTKPVPKPPVTMRKAVPGPAAASVPSGPAVKLSDPKPSKDPRFTRVIDKLEKSAQAAKKHPPASKKAEEAQAAAVPPENEKLAGAQAGRVESMGAAPTGKPEASSFLAMLRAEIQKVMPKKTKDAGDFMKGEDRKQLKGAMTGNVAQQKSEATAGIRTASESPPDPSTVEGKQVTPLPAGQAPGRAPAVGGADAMPAPKPPEEISLAQGRQDTQKLLTDAEVSTPQLQKANDPRFTAVVTAKAKADQFADSGPKQYRKQEEGILSKAGAEAKADEKKGLLGFLAGGIKAVRGVQAKQLTAKEKDEAERKKVTDHIQRIFEKTKETVDKKLAALDEEVSTLFDQGADAAVAKMKDYVEKRFDDRYSGISGKALWLKDKLLPLPSAVKAWFDQAHKVFLQELDALVVRVANLVEKRLKEAKDEIAKGQKEISEYVQSLPVNLKAVGAAAEKEMAGKFDELRQGVDEKKNDLAQKLAQRYKDATEKGAKALQEMKDAHKSLYEKVRDAIAEVIKVLREFKNRIMGMLRKSKAAIDLIVSDPIGFLKNLLSAVAKGISQFVDNIWTHLKEGFMAWLFGSLAESGVEMPKDMSVPSLLKLVLQVLGLTYDRIRAKAVKLLGERAVSVIEHVATVIKELITGGPARLWEMIKEYLGNLKEMVIDAIQNWVVTTVIKAAVTKLISMFNPVGAIIQAIITIYNVVMFFIERIRQIMAFVESIINSVYEIATGAIGAAANWIEKALARTVPLIIAFLARLLGITGITERIVGIIKKIQSKVDRAIDKVIGKIAAGIGKLVGAGKAAVGKVTGWLFPKKSLKAGSRTHTMEVAQEDGQYEILVRSAPRRIPEIIADAKSAKVDTNLIAPLDKAYKEWRSMPKPDPDKAKDADAYKKRSAKFQQAYELTKPVLEELEGAEAVSSIEWQGLDAEGRAKGLKADPLTRQHPKGSTPGEKIPGWDTDLEYSGERVAYIRAHLLHHELGGPGRSFNMAPTSNSYNRRIYHAVEEPTLTSLKGKGSPQFIYTVNVVYAPEPGKAELAKVKPAGKRDKLGYVARKINITVEKKKPGGKKEMFKKFWNETNYG